MASAVQPVHIGVDVSKDELMISIDGAQPFALANTKQAISRWLAKLHGPVHIAMEPTNWYHELLAYRAHAKGHQIYLVNARQLNHYRQGIGVRAKTDGQDALVLERYLRHEHQQLPLWQPPSPEQRRLQALLHRRAILVQARTRIQQSLSGLAELKTSLKALTRRIDALERLINKRVEQLLCQSNWLGHARRCQSIEGIGPTTAAALVMAYQRGRFKSSDAFIAFLGLDVRVRDSGTMRGQRKLTKQGDPELRRLLFLAAMQAKQKPAWQGFYQRHLRKGLARIQVLNILARKLARVAFAIMRNNSEYQPGRACMQT